jgi:hypothetical protein
MTTEVSPASRPSTARRAVDLTVSIILIVVGLVAIVLVAILDALLTLTSADSPGDVEGATSLAFLLLCIGAGVWLAASIVAIIFMVRSRAAWWLALIALLAPVAAGVGGFLAVTSVVQ